MKYVLFLIFITSLPAAFADSKCALVEMKGEIKRVDHKLILITAPKTMSQKILNVELMARRDVLPYVGQFVQGEFIVKDADPEMKILSVTKIEESMATPLKDKSKEVFNKKKDVPCPPSL